MSYSDYTSITLEDWSFSSLTFSKDNAFQLVDYSGTTDTLLIENILFDSSSVVRDSTVFDIKGTVKTSLTFNNLKLYSSSFGVEASTTTNNIFLKLTGSSDTLTTIQNWDI